MFSGWGAFAIPVNPSATERDPPPPRPVMPELPNYTPKTSSIPLTRQSSDRLRSQLFRTRTPLDITADHVESLNVRFLPDQSLETFVRGEQYRHRPFRHDDELTAAIRDLTIPNEGAFASVLRLPKEQGKDWPRLGSGHAFYLSLEQMSHYWDSSADQYYEVPDTSETVAGTDIRPPAGEDVEMSIYDEAKDDTAGDSGSTIKMKQVYRGRRLDNGAAMHEEILERTVKSLIDICAKPFRVATSKRKMPKRLLIRDVRVPVMHHCDAGVVPTDRVQARAGKVEGPVMAVHTRGWTRFRKDEDAEKPTNAECVDMYREIGALLLLAQKRARVGRTEIRPGKGKWWAEKRRWGGGKGGHMPYESDEEPTEDPARTKIENEKVDEETTSTSEDVEEEATLVKSPKALGIVNSDDPIPLEVNVPPLPARKRKSEQQPARTATTSVQTEEKERKRSKSKTKHHKQKHTSRFLATMEQYRSLKVAESLWDENITYKQIGKDTASDFDDVFVMSAINHHVCFLKMRVSRAYLEWLESGQEVESQRLHGDPKWRERQLRQNTLYVMRSRWFDLFRPEERGELAVGLWRIFSWMFAKERGSGCRKMVLRGGGRGFAGGSECVEMGHRRDEVDVDRDVDDRDGMEFLEDF